MSTDVEPIPKKDWGAADTWLPIVESIIMLLKGVGVLHKDETQKPADKPTGDPVKDFS